MTATDGRWYGSMSPRERRTFWGCFGGWTTDAMDVQIYNLLIPVLISVGLLASNAEAGLIGTVTLPCSAIGGWAAGVLADRYGRALMLQVAVAWFSVFTLLCAFAQDFTQLLVFRGLMGFGFGRVATTRSRRSSRSSCAPPAGSTSSASAARCCW